MRTTRILILSVVCLSLKFSLAAVTVGSCQSDKHPYTTISAAIAAAPVGGVVNVCPGTYPEQLQIDKPITIQGIVGVATITAPNEGLNELPAASGAFPQVYVNNAGGEVRLTNLTIDGSGALVNFEGEVIEVDELCPTGIIQDFAGVSFQNTDGVLDSVNLSNQYASSFVLDDFGPQLIPNCGSGVEFHGSSKAVVRNTNVTNVGFYGIYSDGDLKADHNVVSGGFGPHGAGITAVTGTISSNTVTGSTGYYETTGIQGGDDVRDNNVQSAIYGIAGAAKIRNNTLVNNAISLSQVTEASNNQISTSSPTYYNPGCFNEGCDGTPTGPAYPTIGVDLACGDGSAVRNNSVQGAGVGFANVEDGATIRKTNVFSNVTTVSTSCSQ